MYDLIGDVHGHCAQLVELLLKMGYQNKGGHYAHPLRQAVFLGDFVDRGPEIRRTLELVRGMVEAGSALTVLGNHEFNALCYQTLHPESGHYLRSHSVHHLRQHQATLHEYRESLEDWEDMLEWFRWLPLSLDLEDLRVVHACWEGTSLEVANRLRGGRRITDEFLVEASRRGSDLYKSIERLLKGPEVELPAGLQFSDRCGIPRRNARTRWWLNPDSLPYSAAVLGCEPILETLSQFPLEAKDQDSFVRYSTQDKPVFLGHYWLSGQPERLAPNVACLDYSVALDGRLVAYRWCGERQVDNSHFIWV
ncbi:MAG: metallophosphoesterase [Acidobacteriota bacterium]